MFGVLKGASCRMDPSQRSQWMSHICGTCFALQEGSGFTSRICTNYDAALLSAMYEAQLPDEASRVEKTCLLRRNSRFAVVDPSSPGTRFASAIALLMAGTKIQDHLQDRETSWRFFHRAGNWISRRWIQNAENAARSLGFQTELITEQTNRQIDLESRSGLGFLAYSRPTELAAAAAFGHTALLAAQPQNLEPLQVMGEMFGRIMYTLDSFLDYEEDLAEGKFNPLSAAFQGEDWKSQAGKIFHQAYRDLAKSFWELDLHCPELLQILLVKYLNQKGHRTLQLCRGERLGTCLHSSSRLVSTPGEIVPDRFEEWGGDDPYDPNYHRRRRGCFEDRRRDDSGSTGCDCSGCNCDPYCCDCLCCDGEGCGFCGEDGCNCSDCFDGEAFSGCACGDLDCSGCDCLSCDSGGCDCGSVDCDGGCCEAMDCCDASCCESVECCECVDCCEGAECCDCCECIECCDF